MVAPFVLGDGVEWVVDAFGCDPGTLRSQAQLTALFERAVRELTLHPVAPLATHTFPETGYAAFNLYCCRVRPDWPWAERLGELLGATRVEVRRIARPGPRP